jgi:Fe-S-cluster containining protein
MPPPIPTPWPASWRVEDRLTRSSPYAYACGACSRCCRDKVIPVNPYEVARLAAARSVSTSRFLAECTDGVALKRREDGTCIFLGTGGCTVHADRPLVCRLYPLGRRIDAEGAETFHHATPHPQTAGVYSERGTVQSYLDSQGAAPFLAAADAYLAVFERLFKRIEALEGGVGVSDWPDESGRSSDWLDIELALGAPRDGESAEQRMAAHIRWLDQRDVT